jgi:hypothetical protein
VQARNRGQHRYRPWADPVSIERPPPSPRLIDSSSSTSLARRAALTSLTSGKELPSCRALFCTATWRRFKTTEARAGDTPFWTRARRSAICSGVQLRLDKRTILNHSCLKSLRLQSIPTYVVRSVRPPTEKSYDCKNGDSLLRAGPDRKPSRAPLNGPVALVPPAAPQHSEKNGRAACRQTHGASGGALLLRRSAGASGNVWVPVLRSSRLIGRSHAESTADSKEKLRWPSTVRYRTFAAQSYPLRVLRPGPQTNVFAAF